MMGALTARLSFHRMPRACAGARGPEEDQRDDAEDDVPALHEEVADGQRDARWHGQGHVQGSQEGHELRQDEQEQRITMAKLTIRTVTG